MADAVSVTASVITLAQMTLTVLGYLHSVNSAKKEREVITCEATDILGLLNSLRFRLESSNPNEDWFVAVRGLADTGGPFNQYQATSRQWKSFWTIERVIWRLEM